jgi:DNA repair exonuclease SbcCD ATPase subunit
MRRSWILVAWCLALATGCKGKSEATSAPDPAALKAQQELIARRDALLAQRQKLAGERDKLSEEIKAVEAKGGDTSELTKKKADLEQQMQGQDAELDTIRTNVETTLAKIAAAGDAAAGLASREANMGSREDRVAKREAQLAERERVLASRETQLAQREKETCGVAAPMIIQQVAPPPKGGNYTRKEIEPLLRTARQNMQKKGILAGDLGPAASLESDATKAMADGDWGKAYLAAAQLAATVDAIKIDRNFVSAKYNRLQQRVKSGKLDEATSASLTEGMKVVVQKYGDGDFAATNKKLNELWALGGFR